MTNERRRVDEATSLRRTHQSRFGELVREIGALHEALAGKYETLAFRATSDTNKLVFKFFVQHERDTAAELQQFIEDCPENLRERWFKYSPETPLRELEEGFDLDPDTPPDQVLEETLRLNRAIQTILTPMEESACTEDLLEALEKLRQREEEHAKRGTSAVNNS